MYQINNTIACCCCCILSPLSCREGSPPLRTQTALPGNYNNSTTCLEFDQKIQNRQLCGHMCPYSERTLHRWWYYCMIICEMDFLSISILTEQFTSFYKILYLAMCFDSVMSKAETHRVLWNNHGIIISYNSISLINTVYCS